MRTALPLSTILTLAMLSMAADVGPAFALEPVTYLLPGPPNLPAFAPLQIAQAKGYFAQEGLAVTFQVGKGGADVGKQVAVGNADLGGGIGDTPLLIRANGLPIKGVALLGRGGLTQIIVRKDAHIDKLADLKGKRIGVVAFQNTNYYALLAVLARNGLDKTDVHIEAVGQAAVISLMVAGQLDAISNVPENAIQIEDAGVPVETYPVLDVYPAMAQAILASDDTIRTKPAVIRGFVHAVLHAIRDIQADPAAAARVYVDAVPDAGGRENFMEKMLRLYVSRVYATESPSDLGTFDPKRLKEVEEIFLKNNVIRREVPILDLYTNDFVN
jgi:NitT/TauT family transport system substrate-binding protein